jgi:hypothetical protein
MRKEGGEKDVQNREANMEGVDIQKITEKPIKAAE